MEDVELEPDVPIPIPVGSIVAVGAHRTRVRASGRRNAPPVVLLHGLTASSGINWMHLFGPLAEHVHVIAPDLRGHADGAPIGRAASMDDFADDVASLLDSLGVGSCVVVGFSMGGAVAQTLARRRPDLVSELVLVATAPRFLIGPISRVLYGANAIGARVAALLPGGWRARALPRVVKHPDPQLREFVYRETRKHRARSLIRAAEALGRFKGAKFLGEVDVPATVLVSSDDRTLDPRMQRRFAELLPDVTMVELAMGHSDIIWRHEHAAPAVVEAILAAAERAASREPLG